MVAKISPYINTNENIWRWLTEDGMFQATLDRYHKSFHLTFLRYVEEYVPSWEILYKSVDNFQTAKQEFVECVHNGLEQFMNDHSITIDINPLQIERMRLPINTSRVRIFKKKKYKILWHMEWQNTNRYTGCLETRGHFCRATIDVEILEGNYYNKKATATRTFGCNEVEKGWELYNYLQSNIKIALMEELL